jgi:hypothetical protein
MNLQSALATKVLGTLALIGIAAASWFLALGPQSEAISANQTAITETRDQNSVLRVQLAALKKQERELPATLAADKKLEELFPRTADQPGLFQQVGRAASQAGIPASKVTTLAPTAPTLEETGTAAAAPADPAVAPADPAASADLARQTVTISVEANYADTQKLLDQLEDMPRAYLISSLTVGAGSTPGTFLTAIGGDMFVMPPAPRP